MARARPCTQSVHGRGRPCTRAVNTAVYTAVNTAVHTVTDGRTMYRLCTAAIGRVHSLYTAVHGPRTWSVRDPITAAYTAVHGVYGSCTMACKGRVHGASTAMYKYTYTVGYSVHGLVYGPYGRSRP